MRHGRFVILAANDAALAGAKGAPVPTVLISVEPGGRNGCGRGPNGRGVGIADLSTIDPGALDWNGTWSLFDAQTDSAAPDPGPFDVAFVLLLLQTAFGLLAVLGTIVLGVAFGALPLLGGTTLLGLVGPGVTLVLAIGVARFRRWARTGTVAYEALLILGILLRLLIGRQFAFGLVPVLTVVVLPVAILSLLLSRSARRGLAVARQPSPCARLERPSILEPAA